MSRGFREIREIRGSFSFMTLIKGTNLGVYEILSLWGAGGLDEVYRARDTRLDREAALKVLPASFAGDADTGADRPVVLPAIRYFRDPEAATVLITVVLNWTSALKR